MKYTKSKQIIVLAFIALLSTSLYSQDLIITDEDDSLNCKITKTGDDDIYFTFKYNGEIRSTLLPLNKVKFHQYNYFQTTAIPPDKVFPRFRASFFGGWSYRVAKLADNIPSDFEQYIKDLKSGYHYGLDLSYFFSEQLGLGFKYNVYKSKNKIENIYVTLPDGSTSYGEMSDNISINFIGPVFTTRFLNAGKRNGFQMSLGLGYLGYIDKSVLITDYTIKGSSLGICWDIGYDIGLSENLALGFQLSYMAGTLSQYVLSSGNNKETIKLEKGSYENLSRIDLSIGFIFNR